jgi:hypothetical protein
MNLTNRTELHRIPVRGSRAWETINPIFDAGFLAHVGFCINGQPFVIPTLYGRDAEKLYLHGSAVSRGFLVVDSCPDSRRGAELGVNGNTCGYDYRIQLSV